MQAHVYACMAFCCLAFCGTRICARIWSFLLVCSAVQFIARPCLEGVEGAIGDATRYQARGGRLKLRLDDVGEEADEDENLQKKLS